MGPFMPAAPSSSSPSSARFWAQIFGLLIESEVPLDEIVDPCEPAGDADIRIVRMSPEQADALVAGAEPYSQVADADAVWLQVLRAPDAYILRWPEGLDVAIPDDGTTLLVAERGPLKDSVARLLLGHAISFALPAHGMETFHASIVDVDGEAIMLVGDSGAGKSTMVATMCLAGGRLIADDVAAVRLGSDGRPMAVPAGAKVWIAPDIAAGLGLADGESFGRPHKVAAPLAVAPEAVPLTRVYFMRKRPGTAELSAPIFGKDSVVALVTSLFNPTAKAPEQQRLRFEIMTAIATHARTAKLGWDPAPARAADMAVRIREDQAPMGSVVQFPRVN